MGHSLVSRVEVKRRTFCNVYTKLSWIYVMYATIEGRFVVIYIQSFYLIMVKSRTCLSHPVSVYCHHKIDENSAMGGEWLALVSSDNSWTTITCYRPS